MMLMHHFYYVMVNATVHFTLPVQTSHLSHPMMSLGYVGIVYKNIINVLFARSMVKMTWMCFAVMQRVSYELLSFLYV